MAQLNHKFEAAADAARRFWQGVRDRCQREGAEAPLGATCPYSRSSFAGQHWLRGHQAERSD